MGDPGDEFTRLHCLLAQGPAAGSGGPMGLAVLQSAYPDTPDLRGCLPDLSCRLRRELHHPLVSQPARHQLPKDQAAVVSILPGYSQLHAVGQGPCAWRVRLAQAGSIHHPAVECESGSQRQATRDAFSRGILRLGIGRFGGSRTICDSVPYGCVDLIPARSTTS